MRSSTKDGRSPAGRPAGLCGAVLAALAAFAPVGAVAAQPAKPVAARLAAAVTEGAKVTLNETSIAGPGLAAPVEIAWTGTDAAHHLNIRAGTDGLHFPTKTTLPETSPNGPAIVELPIEGPPFRLVLAWRGTDPGHSLNVESLPSGSKLTLHETSFASPALTTLNSPIGVLLAWTGTDPNHSLNVLPLTSPDSGALVPGTKTVLPQFSSDAGPGLASIFVGGTQFQFVLGWSVRGTQRLNLAESADGVHFASALGSGLPQTSATAPQFAKLTNAQGLNAQPCITWTGTDPAHHLNVQCTTQFPQFPDPAHTKTVLPETALGAPGFSDGEIAWTGTDPAHHLNVARLQLP